MIPQSAIIGEDAESEHTMIKVLHFADVHIGMENYGRMDPKTGLSTRVMDFVHRMDEMIHYALERDVDLCIFAGDAFKTRNPNPTFQREFAYRIQDLAEHCPVVLLVGNHDIPPNIKRASSIELYNTLRVPNVHVGMDYDVFDIETKSGSVKIGTAPYPVRERLLEDSPRAVGIAQLDDMLQANLHEMLDQMAEAADQDPDMPRLLTGHFTILGATLGSERQVMLGRDVAASLSTVADPRWDYVAMGHIHKHQNLNTTKSGQPPVIYSGSLERIDFGEEGDPKGFVWVELERGDTRYEFVPVKSRPFQSIYVDVRGELNPTQTILDKIQDFNLLDAVVRVMITCDPETDALINQKLIEDELLKRGANVIAAIKRDVQRNDRTRFDVKPEVLTPIELLERYLHSKSVEDDQANVLLSTAEELIRDVDEANF